MNITVLRSGPWRLASLLRPAGILCLAFCPVAAHAQIVTLSQTYSVPQVIDGGARSVFYDFSSFGLGAGASISNATLSINFAKVPDLSDDPPFFSEIGLSLRKLNTSFSLLAEATLLAIGSFNDGAPASSFDGTITFTDSAGMYANSDPDLLTAGVYKPAESLSLLNGVFSSYWELRIDDASFQNPFLFRSATLTLAAVAAVAVPEPSTLTFVLAFILASFVWSQRRRTAR